MASKKSAFDNDFIKELQQEFCREGMDLLNSSEACLLKIENREPGWEEDFAILKRNFHSLKGGANASGLSELSQAIHQIEFYLVTPDKFQQAHLDEFFKACDVFRQYLLKISGG